MFAELFAVIAPILICASLGYIWAKKELPYQADFVSTLVMNIGAPCLIVSTLGEVDIPRSDVASMALASAAGLILVSMISYLALKLSNLPQRSYLPSLIFPNTGNMGLPLCLFAFGEQGLGMALILFIIISMCHFSIGVTIVSGGNVLKQFLRSPVVYAAAISAVLIVTDWQLPVWAANTVGLLGGMSIPLMLIALGVSLASLKIQHAKTSLLLGAGRLLIGFAVALFVVNLLELEGVMRGVVLIQLTMPAAVFNYLLSVRYQRHPEEVAGVVVSSTLMSFISLPFLLMLVL